MEINEALSLIEYAMSQNEEELLFQRWIPFQHIPFDEFVNQLKPKKIKSEEEILNEVKEILALFER